MHLDALDDKTILTIKLLYFKFCSIYPEKKKKKKKKKTTQAMIAIWCDKTILGSQRSKKGIK
jgi:hypothetical protein